MRGNQHRASSLLPKTIGSTKLAMLKCKKNCTKKAMVTWICWSRVSPESPESGGSVRSPGSPLGRVPGRERDGGPGGTRSAW